MGENYKNSGNKWKWVEMGINQMKSARRVLSSANETRRNGNGHGKGIKLVGLQGCTLTVTAHNYVLCTTTGNKPRSP